MTEQCTAKVGRLGRQCRRTAMQGRIMCSTHGAKYKYHIRVQRRKSPGPGQSVQDWRSWRQFSVWPKVFDTRDEAQAFMRTCFTFQGLSGRKLSAAVATTRLKHPTRENVKR